jgi:hypothetical protein
VPESYSAVLFEEAVDDVEIDRRFSRILESAEEFCPSFAIDEPVVACAGPDRSPTVRKALGDVFGHLWRDDVICVAVEDVEGLRDVA